ncbi:MAG: NADH:ubiquinone oxidoreductase subunit NDUFA12 [Rhodospirillales bacterium]|nr:NADH:ubiquinone oxidoreductase subunit NDUFA12 [Rhodospirillales bacterium]
MGATIGTRLFTKLAGRYVGKDEFGNRYYKARGAAVHADSLRHERRWVIYKDGDEATKVPAEWHGWLHHTTDELPPEKIERKAWQKPHRENLTGTPEAYRPPGHTLMGGKRAASGGDYEPWKPE